MAAMPVDLELKKGNQHLTVRFPIYNWLVEAQNSAADALLPLVQFFFRRDNTLQQSRAPAADFIGAFSELQQMIIENNQKLKLADLQIDTLKRVKQRATVTAREIKNQSDDTKTYESVGRMFVLTDVSAVLDNLTKKSDSCDEKIKALEVNKKYVEKCMKESENNLREMVQQRKDKDK